MDSSDVESDPDDLDLNVISKYDIEEETFPISKTVKEDGEVEKNTHATSAGDGEIEDGMENGTISRGSSINYGQCRFGRF